MPMNAGTLIDGDSYRLPSLLELGRRFATLRAEVGVDEVSAAARIGVGTDVIEDFERHGMINPENLIRLLEAFSLSSDLETAFHSPRDLGSPKTIGEVVEAWGRGVIDTPTALSRRHFEGFADLLETTIMNEVPLRTELTAREARQAEVFTQIMRGA
jgi:hypothetical protein